jgi:outer membrane protein assembly factor BamB
VSAFGDADRVFIHSEARMFELGPVDGEIASVSTLEEAISAPPAVSLQNDRAIFGGSRGLVFAHSLTAGRTSWKYRTNAGITTPPIIDGNSVLVCNTAGLYLLLTVDEREVQWSNRTFDAISAKPILTNLGVFIPCEDNNLYARQRINGLERWTFRSTQALTRDPLLHRTTIYLPVPDRGLVALNAITGKMIWEEPTQALPVTVTGRGLLLNDRTKLMVVDADRGGLVAEAPTLWMQDVVQGPNGSLILVSPYGKLERIDPR